MIAEIISIGTELILGDVNDINSTFIARQLTAAGFDIHNITVIGDNEKRLVTALKQAMNRSDIVITTGGLGPTEDDITRQAVADASGNSLIKSSELVTEIKEYFREKGYTFTTNNLKQAYLPYKAEVIRNKWGTAPGFLLKTEGKIIISLPGVPGEMRKMFIHEILPFLRTLQQRTIKSKVLHLFGIGESTLEEKIKDVLNNQSNPTIALLAGKGEVKIRITASGNEIQKIDSSIAQVENKIRKKVGSYIYGTDGENLAAVVGKISGEKKIMLGLAESCTGGLVADRITDVPGSSEYFQGGVVAYSNNVKNNVLGVKKQTLKKYGAVSKETVMEMAHGITRLLECDIGMGISGIAGPGGGSKEKPVGLVYIALQSKKTSVVHELNLNGDREWNKWMTSQYALFYLFKTIKNGVGE